MRKSAKSNSNAGHAIPTRLQHSVNFELSPKTYELDRYCDFVQNLGTPPLEITLDSVDKKLRNYFDNELARDGLRS
jgi:hypothetical protein